MTTTEQKLLTADDLLRLDSQGVRGELIRGVLCETMPAGQEHGEIAANLTTLLVIFVKPRKLGRITVFGRGGFAGAGPGHGAGTGYSLLLGGEKSRRGHG